MTSLKFNLFIKIFCLLLVGLVGLSFQPHFVAETAPDASTTIYLPVVFNMSRPALSEDGFGVNFQDHSTEVPAGFIADYGLTYGSQEGRTYGWNVSHEDETRTRDMHFDPLLDTLIHVKEAGYWEMAVDNGWYEVTMAIGDPAHGSTYTVDVEGTRYWDDDALSRNTFNIDSDFVQVTDGRLTVSVGGRAHKDVRLNYITIEPHSGPDSKGGNEGTDTIDIILYNADSDQPIAQFDPLTNNAELDVNTLPGSSWSFVADVSGIQGNVGSVVFSGSYERVENSEPHAVFGDVGVDITGRWLTPGTKTLTVEAFSEPGGNGESLAKKTVNFKVVSSNQIPVQTGDCDQTVSSFNDIDWEANSVICLSQGTYEDTLDIGAEGVTIRGLGTVILFGGRDQPLPYCGQKNYNATADHDWGIKTRGYSNLVIENLTIHGYGVEGVHIDRGTNDSLFRNLVIYDNGSGELKSDGYWPGGEGIRLNGHNITLDRVQVFNNGEDQIQNYSNVSIKNLTITNSWLYNDRKHPDRDDSFNHCAHSDGIQIFSGDKVDGILIENTYFSGLTQCVVFGETKSSMYTTVNDVTIRDVVCDQASGMGIYSKNPNSTNWLLERVTIYCNDGYTGHCIHINGSNTTIKNSIIDGSRIVIPQGITSQSSGNCQDNISKGHNEHVNIGPDVNLNYVNAGAPFSSNNDFTLVNSGNCVGSALTSLAQLQLK